TGDATCGGDAGGNSRRRGTWWARQPAASTTATAGGDAAASRADRIGDAAVTRSARGPESRALGRRAGRMEYAHALDNAADQPRARRHAFGSGVFRKVRHPGQLQRIRNL